jgi:protein ImuB
VRIEAGLFRPSADENHLAELMRMQLEQTPLPGPVGRVRLEATITAPLENRQGELFAGGRQEAERHLALLMDRCSSRLGEEAVLRPRLAADPLPERRVRYRAGVEGRRSEVRGPKSEVRGRRSVAPSAYDPASDMANSALLRPIILYSPPEGLEVLSIAPDGPPVAFRFRGQHHELAASCGPERIETGWWRGKSVRRDYWRIATATGQRFWIFRQLNDGRWYLHGEFS